MILFKASKKLVFLIAVLSFTFVSSQQSKRDYDEELRYQNQAINSMKKEMKNLQARIEKANSKETSTSKRIIGLDEEIAFLRGLLQTIKNEESRFKNQVGILKKDILNSEKILSDLRMRYKDRVINIYSQGRLTQLEKVLSSTSWRQAVYRSEYLKIISDIEKEISKKIERTLIKVSKQKLEMETALRQSILLKIDKEKQMALLRKMRIKRQKELSRIQNDKVALANYIREKNIGVKQLENIIKKVLEDKARSEREKRIRAQQDALKTKSFTALKGQLQWPTQGKIISKYGKHWNSKLKTTTDNPGIDIKGRPGAAIRTIMNGIVTTITYIRGYGTTIIIDHGSGFYTVYSHVTNIKTNIDSEVQNGDVIAYMGDSGSINGSKLHFEIWGKGQKLNPEKWLKKQQ
tara:strand:- start:1408 stop:2622 length:1215 start_codon:yes stop_codon:yes gene_type:complete